MEFSNDAHLRCTRSNTYMIMTFIVNEVALDVWHGLTSCIDPSRYHLLDQW